MTLMAIREIRLLRILPSFFPFTLFSSGARAFPFGQLFASAVEPARPVSVGERRFYCGRYLVWLVCLTLGHELGPWFARLA